MHLNGMVLFDSMDSICTLPWCQIIAILALFLLKLFYPKIIIISKSLWCVSITQVLQLFIPQFFFGYFMLNLFLISLV